MYRTGCAICVILIDQNRDADLGRTNHADVDICIVESLEHLGSYAGVRLHACANDRYLSYMLFVINCFALELITPCLFQNCYRILQISSCNRKGDIFLVAAANRLKNNIYTNDLRRKNIEYLKCHTGFILNTYYRDSCYILIGCYTAD